MVLVTITVMVTIAISVIVTDMGKITVTVMVAMRAMRSIRVRLRVKFSISVSAGSRVWVRVPSSGYITQGAQCTDIHYPLKRPLPGLRQQDAHPQLRGNSDLDHGPDPMEAKNNITNPRPSPSPSQYIPGQLHRYTRSMVYTALSRCSHPFPVAPL